MGLACMLVLASSACRDGLAPTGSDDWILFRSSRDGAMNGAEILYEIYRMKPDGSGVEKLTAEPSNYDDVDATPDGRTVIFTASLRSGDSWTSSSDCPARLWRMAPDGTQLRPITSGSCSYNAHLSPNGARIAYQRGSEIYVSDLDGNGETHVSGGLPPVEPSSCGQTPRTTVYLTGWFDLDRLSFWRHICGVGNTYYIVDFRGETLAQVDPSSPATAHLSPDHTRLAFMLASEVRMRNADGSGSRTLTAVGALPGSFSVAGSPWSPDGKRVYVFTSDWQEHFAVDADDGSVSRITMLPRAAFNGWSPRGDRIVWTMYTSPSSNIYVSNADGSDAVNLTNSSSHDEKAVWVGRR